MSEQDDFGPLFQPRPAMELQPGPAIAEEAQDGAPSLARCETCGFVTKIKSAVGPCCYCGSEA